MSGKFSQRFLTEQQAADAQPGSAQGYYGTFAMRWNHGDPPICEYWVLKEEESWHDAVQGDGSSYIGPGPDDILPHRAESLVLFRRRCAKFADLYNE